MYIFLFVGALILSKPRKRVFHFTISM